MPEPEALPIPTPKPKEPFMAAPEVQQYELGNLQLALTALGNESGAAAAARIRRFDQLSADASSMWAVHLTTPTVFAGMGYQAAAGHMPPRQTEVGSAAAPGAPATKSA